MYAGKAKHQEVLQPRSTWSVLQMSTVCKKYAEAASLVASLQLGLEAAGEHYTLDRLDSALLL